MKAMGSLIAEGNAHSGHCIGQPNRYFMNKKISVLCGVILLHGTCMRAEGSNESPNEDPKLKIIKTDETIRGLFKQTRPASPKDGDVGLYTIKEKKNRFMMQPFGYVKPIMGWDIGNALDDISFVPAQIPVPAKKGNKAAYFANPLHSSIGVHIVALPATAHQVTAYLQLQFSGDKATVRCNHAYIGYRGFILGRTGSLFIDGDAIPETIDPQGPNGAVDVHSYQVSYQKHFDCGVGLGISMEIPTFDKYPGEYYGKDYPELDGTQYYADATQPVPDIPLYIQYQGKGLNRVRLSGIIRNFFYQDVVADKTKSLMGWGIQLSGNIQPCNPLLLYYECSYGKGIANYIQDTNGLPLSYIPKDSHPGDMSATPMMGWLAGFSYEFPSRLKLTGVYSQARVWKSGVYYPDYKMGQYVAANVSYPIKEYLRYEVEYLWGDHLEYGHKSASLNRIQTTLKLSF